MKGKLNQSEMEQDNAFTTLTPNIPKSAIKSKGIYHTKLGQSKLKETLPKDFSDGRLTLGNQMNRDLNGARGIFLRALVDTPWLHSFLAI